MSEANGLVTLATYRKVGKLIADHEGLAFGDYEAFRQGRGLIVVKDWDGKGRHSIVGETGTEWSYATMRDDNLRQAIRALGVYDEPQTSVNVGVWFL